MARDKRANSFLFEPLLILEDEAFQAMSLEARGAYFSLFLRAWLQKRPGRILNDPRVLAELSSAGERWGQVATEVCRAFKIDGDRLVSPMMVRTHRKQTQKLLAKKTAGRRAAKLRWDKAPDGSPIGYPIQGSVLGSRFSGSEKIEKEKTPSAVRPRKEIDPEGFQAFYAAYPRRVNRRQAVKAYVAARKRRPDWEPDDLKRAAEAFGFDVKDRDPQYIPHPATWLNADSFLDQEADHEQSHQPPERRVNPEGRAAVQALVLGVLEQSRGVG